MQPDLEMTKIAPNSECNGQSLMVKLDMQFFLGLPRYIYIMFMSWYIGVLY